MNYSDHLQNVAILGAAGKMGSGILLLTAVEMADLSLKPENKDKSFVLNAIDLSDKGLAGLREYLRVQVQKIAEKKTVQLRQIYANRTDLIENSEIIDQYVSDTLGIVRTSTRIESAYDAKIIFEAASENPKLKVNLFSVIDKNNSNKPWFFTNTSSIPISYLEKEANLNGRIIGFHFYNPPAVQKLVELITTPATQPDLDEFALAYAKNLRKVVVRSKDKAGFIGNGHFMRDILHAAAEVESLQKVIPFTQAVYIINKVSQDYLVRPMGIFQLIDYVGIDVCSFIMNVMNPYYTEENIYCALLEHLLSLDVKGGQNSDGSQKDGILKYEKGKISAIFDPETRRYIPLAEVATAAESYLGSVSYNLPLWKNVVKLNDKDIVLQQFFTHLKTAGTKGADLAVAYGKKSKAIGEALVNGDVAFKTDDVNTVLMTGFFHSYGPINSYFD